eukprot:4828862-Prymnesium_polylepis.1
MLCAGVSVVAMRRARALARCSARCAMLAALTIVPCAQVLTVSVAAAGACPNAVRARRCRYNPRCCAPARGCVTSRALLSAALRAESC